MLKEEIKFIEDTNEKYAISNHWYIISYIGMTTKKLALYTHSAGYRQVAFTKVWEKRKTHYIHRLVGKYFLPKVDNKKIEINHKDWDKTNNNVDNLEWVTHKENIRHSIHVLGNIPTIWKLKIMLWKFWKEHPSSKAIIATDKDDITSEEIRFDSLSEAAKYLYVDQGNISKCLKGQHKTAWGYKFRYAWLSK